MICYITVEEQKRKDTGCRIDFVWIHMLNYKKTVHNQRINMTILGEALCIDTMNFFEDQLYPVIFKHFNNFLNIDYVPYGNVKIVNGSMVCQHGFMECFINRYQSCMIDVLEKQDEYLPLFSCLEYKLKRRIPFNYALWGCYDTHPLPSGTKRLIQ
ncbi:gamma interferon inducible lysosomal thiol reductase [Oesophagostomum dentatum]|uniref:Gamma interferon inducible lysosomal thiol reductase n=1 Tax=Oesophagostomum dentatum TaxID=61180 RepID=A0A0B1SPG2_OESDE|nr:gamma interferon inducible lysosomal thiol reductase [Oesophagostomum dentatum]